MFLLHAGGAWEIGFIGSTVTGLTFSGIAVMLAIGLTRQRGWGNNILGVGTFLIFVTCGGGHLIHTIQMLGGDSLAGHAARDHYAEWHLWLADGLTAAAGTAYWLLRRRLGGVLSGAAIYEDLRVKKEQASWLHDEVVQEMAKARLALDLGDLRAAQRHLRDAKAAAERTHAHDEAWNARMEALRG
ncbi:MAG: hypothetical protein ACPHID_03920 [Thermoplasmatota archaeon]